MNETQLQIIISVLNNATEGLAAIGDSLSAMSDQAAAAGASMSADMQSSLTAAEEAAAAAADASTASWGEFEDSASASIASVASAAQGDFESMSSAALAAADAASAAWQTSVGELNATLGELPAEATTVGEEAGANLSTGLESSISSLGGKLMAGGAIAGLISAAITAPVVAAIGDAASKQSTLAIGTQELTNIIQANSGGVQQNATQIADLTAKIDAYKAQIAVANAGLTQWVGTTAEVNAKHEQERASIALVTSEMQPYVDQLQALSDKQGLGAQTAQQLSDQFQTIAEQNTNLGVGFDDSYNALLYFTNQMGNVKDAQLAYNDAVGLYLSGKVSDMATATQDVTQAFNGMGRGLQNIVPDLKDGAAGADALNQIWSVVQGVAPVAAQQLSTQTAALGTNSQELGAALTSSLTPGLTGAAQGANSLMQELTKFANDHSTIAGAISAIALAVGGLGTALGTLGFGAGALLLIGEAFDTIATVGIGTVLETVLAPLSAVVGWIGEFGAGLLALDPPALAIAAAILAVVGAIVLIITHISEIENFIATVMNASGATALLKQAWDNVVSAFNNEVKPALQQLWDALQPLMPYIQLFAEAVGVILLAGLVGVVMFVALFITGLEQLLTVIIKVVTYIVTQWVAALKNVNDAIADVINWFEQLPGAVENAVSKAVSFFQPLINAFQTAVNLAKEILSAISGPVGAVVSTVGNAVGGAIKAFASGGIVNGPTLALVGEAGPEAIIPLSAFSGGGGLAGGGAGGGGGNIQVFIQGGTYLDQNGATTIANALARQIGLQLKLKNFF